MKSPLKLQLPRDFLARHAPLLVVLVVLALASGLFGVLYPAWIRWLLGELSQDVSVLHQVLFWGVVLAVYQATISALRAYTQGIFTARLIADLRQRVAAQLLRLPLPWFDTRHSGELLGRYSGDLQTLEGVLSGQLVVAFQHSFQAQAIMVALVWFEGPRILWLLAGLPFLALSVHWLGRKVRVLARQVREQSAQASSHLSEVLQQLETVKGFRQEALELARIEASLRAQVKEERRLARFRAMHRAVSSLAGLAALIGVAAWLIGSPSHSVTAGLGVDAGLTPARVASTLLYVTLLFGSISAVSGTAGSFYRAYGAAERLFELFQEHTEVVPRGTSMPPDGVDLSARPLLDVRGLSFRYNQALPAVLDNFSVKLRPGEWLALTGPNGSGKSTLIRLVLGLLKAESGVIEIEGQNANDLSPAQRRRLLAYVPQSPGIFSGTVQSNIAYAVSGATDDDVAAVLERMGVTEVIDALPRRLKTRVGEGGRMLSGGQRQLIAIARAVLLRPKLLLLDEATSQLDLEREARLFEHLRKNEPNLAVIAIIHRRWATKHFDTVLDLSTGEITHSNSDSSTA